jgi:hypothetical protein
MAFNPQARPVARCLTWRDPEPGRGQDALRISDLSVTPVPLNHAVFVWLRGGVWAGQDSNTPENSDFIPRNTKPFSRLSTILLERTRTRREMAARRRGVLGAPPQKNGAISIAGREEPQGRWLGDLLYGQMTGPSAAFSLACPWPFHAPGNAAGVALTTSQLPGKVVGPGIKTCRHSPVTRCTTEKDNAGAESVRNEQQAIASAATFFRTLNLLSQGPRNSSLRPRMITSRCCVLQDGQSCSGSSEHERVQHPNRLEALANERHASSAPLSARARSASWTPRCSTRARAPARARPSHRDQDRQFDPGEIRRAIRAVLVGERITRRRGG